MTKTYKELIKDPNIEDIIKGSHFSATNPVEKWEQARKFISKAITKDGTVLDIGCSNGFLLKSLQEWCEYKIIPYGIDNRADHIADAVEMFPENNGNFVETQFDEFLSNYPATLPKQFDFIYWAVWVNRSLDKQYIDTLLEHVCDTGSLILGFYPDSDKDPIDVNGNIPRLKELGYSFEEMGNVYFPNRNEKVIIIKK